MSAAAAATRRSPWLGRVARSLLAGLGVVPVLAGCEDDGTQAPGSLRFGQVGEMQVVVETPVAANGQFGVGALRETLSWGSNGVWVLREEIFLSGEEGDASVRTEVGSAGAYAQLIAQVNGTQGLDLFVPELDPNLDPSCGSLRSRITFRIRDDVRNETIAWRRCGGGPLRDVSATGAGPDPLAVRVVSAAKLTRDFTLGQEAAYTYVGSLPFRTIDRGDASMTQIPTPRAFVGEGGQEPGGWRTFWMNHAGPSVPLPPVDWSSEAVIVAAVGEVDEAGDEVSVRRALRLEGSVLVEYVHRIPGDFCSPASLRHTPFHIVAIPAPGVPIGFATPKVERVSCGG